MATAQGPGERRPAGVAASPSERARRKYCESLVAVQRSQGTKTEILSAEEFTRRRVAAGVHYGESRKSGRLSPAMPSELLTYYKLARGREGRAKAFAAIGAWHLANDQPR